MREAGRRGVYNVGRALRVMAVLAVVLLGLPWAATGARGSAPTSTPGSPTTFVNVTTVFDGGSTAGHNAPASAIPTTFDHAFDLLVNWSAYGGALGTPSIITVTGVRVSVLLLNEPAFTQETDERTPVSAPTGSIDLTLDFTQDRYLVEGLYLLSVQLLGPGSAVIATHQFYISAGASYHLTALNLALIGLIAYEAVQVGLDARRSRRRRPKGGR